MMESRQINWRGLSNVGYGSTRHSLYSQARRKVDDEMTGRALSKQQQKSNWASSNPQANLEQAFSISLRPTQSSRKKSLEQISYSSPAEDPIES